MGAVNLAESLRKFGHLAARIDPLGSKPPGDPSLRPEFHGVTDDELRSLPASLIVGPIALGMANAWDVIQTLRAVPFQGQVAIRPMMYVALSYDHRIIDGLEAVRFLMRIKELVEDPGNLLLES